MNLLAIGCCLLVLLIICDTALAEDAAISIIAVNRPGIDAVPGFEKLLQTIPSKNIHIEKLRSMRAATGNGNLPTVAYDKLFLLSLMPVTTTTAGTTICVGIRVNNTAGIKRVRRQYRTVNREEAYKTLAISAGPIKDVYQLAVAVEKIHSKLSPSVFLTC